MKKSFFKFILDSTLKKIVSVFFILFFIIGKIYLYQSIAGVPCDGAFLCGFYNHLSDINLFPIIMLDFFVTVPAALVFISYWGLYKRDVKFKQ